MSDIDELVARLLEWLDDDETVGQYRDLIAIRSALIRERDARVKAERDCARLEEIERRSYELRLAAEAKLAEVEKERDEAMLASVLCERTEALRKAEALLAVATEALRQLLDDMGEVGQCVCLDAKEQAQAFLATIEAGTVEHPDSGELPDDLREPLHGLQADREWLVARIRTADYEEAAMLSESIRNRLSQIEEAAYRLNSRAALSAGTVEHPDRVDECAVKKVGWATSDDHPLCRICGTGLCSGGTNGK